MKKNIFLIIGLILLSLVSCNLRKEEVIVFDNSEPLALAPDVFWAVVTEPYAAYKDNVGWKSSGNSHCRQGEILQIKGKSLDSNYEVWYKFDAGWLPESSLIVFDNRYKAQSFSKKIEK